jgi:heavy metal translocating P-type ATPase
MRRMIDWCLEYGHPIAVFFGIAVGLITDIWISPVGAELIWALTVALGGFPVVWKTVKGMFKGQFASDIVASLAIVTSLIMGQFLAGAVVVLMQSGGEALEEYGLSRAKSSLDHLLRRAPQTARRLHNGEIEEISVAQVRIGDRLVVRPGDLIPVDGKVLEGSSDVDESALTGEPLPRGRGPGDIVLSGTIATNGALTMEAERDASGSQYAKIVELMRKAQEQKAPIERIADRAAIFFTPLTLAMALIGYLYTQDPVTVLSVFVVATPCPLILAVPIAIMAGVSRAARSGIICKGGAPLEELGHTQAVVFDKTGTITVGEPFVERILPIDHIEEREFLRLVASLEQLSSHVVAKSIVAKAKDLKLPLQVPSEVVETPGRGVAGRVDGHDLAVGSLRYLRELKLDQAADRLEARMESPDLRGRMLASVVMDGEAAGFVVLGDRLRPGAPLLIETLKRKGIRYISMLTGDNETNAALIAHETGIDHYAANLLPAQKVDDVKKIAAKFPYTVMVGDGINDAPALASARVGIAMGAHGAAISAEAADVVLLVDDISKIGEIISIGQRTLAIAWQSVLLGIGLSFVLMCFAAAGKIPPVAGALSQEVIDVVVILNALRGMSAGRRAS